MDKKIHEAATPSPLPPSHQRRKKVSIALKVSMAPPGWAYNSGTIDPSIQNPLKPPIGKYFFYGTLQDPKLLREVLNLSDAPILEPAHLIGYQIKLWGPYPAVVKKPGAVLRGLQFDVPDEQSAQKLADYETGAYQARPCIIRHGSKPDEGGQTDGHVFLYDGSPDDLSDGEFDLETWLTEMGRESSS